MIGKLSGKIDEILSDSIILDIDGIGYQVYCPKQLLDYALLNAGQMLTLRIESIFRPETGYALYGFMKNYEKSFFKLIISVKGIGPKLGLSIIGHAEVNELISVILQQDKKYLSKFPGIGQKTAERIIVELKDKLVDISEITIEETSKFTNNHMNDATSALLNLGYSTEQIKSIINKINYKDLSVEDIIKQSLLMLAQ